MRTVRTKGRRPPSDRHVLYLLSVGVSVAIDSLARTGRGAQKRRRSRRRATRAPRGGTADLDVCDQRVGSLPERTSLDANARYSPLPLGRSPSPITPAYCSLRGKVPLCERGRKAPALISVRLGLRPSPPRGAITLRGRPGPGSPGARRVRRFSVRRVGGDGHYGKMIPYQRGSREVTGLRARRIFGFSRRSRCPAAGGRFCRGSRRLVRRAVRDS